MLKIASRNKNEESEEDKARNGRKNQSKTAEFQIINKKKWNQENISRIQDKGNFKTILADSWLGKSIAGKDGAFC